MGSVIIRLPIRSYPSQLSRRFFLPTTTTKYPAPLSTKAAGPLAGSSTGCNDDDDGAVAMEPLLSCMGSILTHTLDAFRNILTFSNHVEAVAVSCVASTATSRGTSRQSEVDATPEVPRRRVFGSARLVNAAEVREAKLKVANSKKWRQSSWVFWKKTNPATNSYPLHIEVSRFCCFSLLHRRFFLRNDSLVGWGISLVLGGKSKKLKKRKEKKKREKFRNFVSMYFGDL